MPALLFCALPASAMEWTLHGSVKNETAYFIAGEKRLDKVQNRLDLKPEAIFADGWEFRGRMLGWYDAAMDLEPTNNRDLTPGIKQHYRTYLQSKEAYLLYGGDTFDFRLGQQQIVWGKTDGLRMLDIINPLDMREFMLDDFLDSRIGLWSARLNWYTDLAGSEHEFEFIVVPDARPGKPAPAGSRWAFALPPAPTGTTLVVKPGNEPRWRASDVEAGAAWRSNLSGWDVSLNWFYGWKDSPNMQKSLSPGLLTLTPLYQRMNTVGGSFSNAFGAIVLRGEAAVNISEGINKTGFTAATSTGRATTVNAAFGMDYSKSNWRISPQFFIRYLPGWDNSIAEDQASGFASLMVSTDYLNEKLKPEVIGLYDWADGSWMLRPKASYEFSDQVTAKLGADMFGGSNGFFGQFDKNDRIYTEVEYTF
ncbi:MAG: hypothetical protein CO186_00085 [Zetaproteobacteria bacterium CG_4_9_14_3_um_filter_49_83]|nr:MAG: hypothetical protein COW62_04430 [Zetaproteobacteria bacterium CG17_big_fil_post_rev_8_21_14_2_50_50_13]PIV30743.1 MAG: hypothetical protein COS35_05100 [Zetaproteobacteria bacterium CG02_land_8_20_14_3_00_50_9]PIY55101.1 MAG: hypothetical protein COZ00_11315 [Zetaproteobacteria bacterium CG_4_10_14_0_8_um_filter_49_80]PJA36568.1 MAG: hypothetical protein CO186_00085 [Zetaproteobacteria bacterium CG_4_9_14_3_um_filter_49_83]